MTNSPPKLFAPLHLLRAGAALMVALGHFQEFGAIDLARTFALAVPFFFILSGFVLEHAYGERIRSGTESLWTFAVRRFARLYPLHILTMGCVIGFYGLIELARLFVALPISDVVGLHVTPVQWLEALTLTHFLFGGGVAFNTPSWSIGVEFWGSFYIFALCVAPRAAVMWIALPLMAALFAIIEAQGGLLGGPRTILVPIDKTYMIGMFCFTLGWLLRAHWQQIARWAGVVPAAVWWTFSAAVFVAAAVDPMGPGLDWLYYAAFAVIVAGMSTVHPSSGGRSERWMLALGDWSYGIYLWHLFVMLGLQAVVKLFASRGIDLTGSLILDAIYVSAVLVIAWFVYERFEKPAKGVLLRLLLRSAGLYRSR